MVRGSHDEVVLTTMVISMSSFCDRMPLVYREPSSVFESANSYFLPREICPRA